MRISNLKTYHTPLLRLRFADPHTVSDHVKIILDCSRVARQRCIFITSCHCLYWSSNQKTSSATPSADVSLFNVRWRVFISTTMHFTIINHSLVANPSRKNKSHDWLYQSHTMITKRNMYQTGSDNAPLFRMAILHSPLRIWEKGALRIQSSCDGLGRSG